MPQPAKMARPTLAPEEQAAYARQVLEPALSTIGGRIAAYEQKLQAWQELGSRLDSLRLPPDRLEAIVACRNKVADLGDAYKGLQEKLLAEHSVEASRELLISSLQDFKEKDILYLEGECPPLLAALNAPPPAGPAVAYAVPENPSPSAGESSGPASATQTVGAEDYGQVVQNFEAGLMTAKEEPDGESRYGYGMALLKNRREQEGRRVFVELLAASRQQNNRTLEASTLRTLAELEFGLREYSSARKRYEELQRIEGGQDSFLAVLQSVGTRREELDDYASLLLGCLAYQPAQDGFTVVQQADEFVRLFPSSPLGPSAAGLARKIEAEAEQWFAGLIAAVDRLLTEQRHEEAAKMLDGVPLDILPLDKQDVLRRKKAELPPSSEVSSADVPLEAASHEQISPEPQVQELSPLPTGGNGSARPEAAAQDAPPLAAVADPQKAWDNGMTALQAAQYDEAIKIFSGLLGTAFSVQAEGKKKEAADLAAQELRRKAAGLFQKASDATVPEVKREFYLSSRALLEEILRKYPGTALEGKVRGNLKNVDEKLAALGRREESP